MTVINSNRAVRGPVTAVPLVAGKGVKITADTVNNRYVAEVDETVLYTDDEGQPGGFTLSESVANFEMIKIIYSPSNATSGDTTYNYGKCIAFFDGPNMADCKKVSLTGMMPDGGVSYSLVIREKTFTLDATGTIFTSGHSHQLYYNGSAWSRGSAQTYIYKVVGINRVQGGN